MGLFGKCQGQLETGSNGESPWGGEGGGGGERPQPLGQEKANVNLGPPSWGEDAVITGGGNERSC